MSDPTALALLTAATTGVPHHVVAAKLGYSRTAVTLYLSGKYPGGVARLEARIVERLGGVDCPFLGRTISNADCASHASRDCPSTSPMALRHWQACKTCDHNPKRKDAE